MIGRKAGTVSCSAAPMLRKHLPAGEFGQQRVDRVVEPDPALLDQQHRRGRGDRLAHGADPEDGVGAIGRPPPYAVVPSASTWVCPRRLTNATTPGTSPRSTYPVSTSRIRRIRIVDNMRPTLACVCVGERGATMPKTWLVTGSSRGIGSAICRAALDSGDNVVATARRPAASARSGQTPTAIGYARSRWTSPTRPRRKGGARGGRHVRPDRRGRQQRRQRQQRADRAHLARRVPRPDRDQPARRHLRLEGRRCPTSAPSAPATTCNFSSIGGRVGGTPGIAPYQAAKFGVEGFSLVLGAGAQAVRGRR